MAEPLHFQLDEYYLDLQKQGQDMAIMDREQTQRNPFPGLRPFRTAEAHLFFGREGQAEELIARLMQTHFLGVLGNSGSGKSSLVRAGLIPALHAGKKQRRIADWKIVICRPGNSPVQNLAAALAGANKNTTDEKVLVSEVLRLLPILQESSFGLLEAEAGSDKHGKTLLIVDQFEELFRFGREIPPGEAAHFVDLLLTAVRQEGSNLYAVVTMRSEFLGECVRYRGLPEIINKGQYLVPRLTGENVRRAVAGPLGVVGGPVDPTLVNRLVREVGDNMDQLPLLQHALMRTYHHWQQQGHAGNPITHADYEAVGGIDKALSQHANEHFAALDEQGQRIAKIIFQRLTDLSSGEKGGRRPTLLEEIFGIAEALDATPAQTEAVINHFRQTDTSFLMPPPGVSLQPQNMLDISHESLIRNWELLSGWAAEEVQNARLYQRLQQARLENDDDQHQGWIKGALLQRLEEWRQTTPLNYFWAARYHENSPEAHEWAYDKEQFEKNMTFLDQCIESERRREKEKEDAIVKEARQKQRTRYRNIIIALTTGAALVAISLAIEAYNQRRIAQEQQVLAERQKMIADSLLRVTEGAKEKSDFNAAEALRQKGLAEKNYNDAQKNLKKAQYEEARAKTALEQVNKEKSATEEQRQRAEENYRLAQQKTEEAKVETAKALTALNAQQKALSDVVHLTLAEVNRLIYTLDYNSAFNKIQTIASFGISQQEVSDALLEFAFWYAETGNSKRAWAVLDTAYRLVDRVLPQRRSDRDAAHAAIRSLNPARDSFLQTRYYPLMKNVAGGPDTLGFDNNYVVTLSSFQLAETEITWWQYNLFWKATNRENLQTPGWGTDGDNPAVNVSWYDAVEYLNWLSERHGHKPAYNIDKKQKDPNNNNESDEQNWTVSLQSGADGFRLPTEAEWEFAARAGTNLTYAGSNVIDDVARYGYNSRDRSEPTKTKFPNGNGLYDMAGNVWEWCWDWYDFYPLSTQNNPTGPASGLHRVLRGGSWLSVTQVCRVDFRYHDFPINRLNYVGFRPARTVTF